MYIDNLQHSIEYQSHKSKVKVTLCDFVCMIYPPAILSVELLGFHLLLLQYVRNPITCWAPVHFTCAHTKFMTSYCWVKNTYYLPWTKPIPRFDSDYRQMVPYYQWIPFILLAQVC